jgi:hypothetical protein
MIVCKKMFISRKSEKICLKISDCLVGLYYKTFNNHKYFPIVISWCVRECQSSLTFAGKAMSLPVEWSHVGSTWEGSLQITLQRN